MISMWIILQQLWENLKFRTGPWAGVRGEGKHKCQTAEGLGIQKEEGGGGESREPGNLQHWMQRSGIDSRFAVFLSME